LLLIICRNTGRINLIVRYKSYNTYDCRLYANILHLLLDTRLAQKSGKTAQITLKCTNPAYFDGIFGISCNYGGLAQHGYRPAYCAVH
jgi:hypothetical protein